MTRQATGSQRPCQSIHDLHLVTEVKLTARNGAVCEMEDCQAREARGKAREVLLDSHTFVKTMVGGGEMIEEDSFELLVSA